MRALPDKWNPRLWLRDWFKKLSHAERAEIEAFSNPDARALFGEGEARAAEDTALANRITNLELASSSLQTEAATSRCQTSAHRLGSDRAESGPSAPPAPH